MPNLNLNSGAAPAAFWTTGDGANVNVVIGGTLADSLSNLATAVNACNASGAIGGASIVSMYMFYASKDALLLFPYDVVVTPPVVDPASPLPVLAASQVADPWTAFAAAAQGGRVSCGSYVVTAEHLALGAAIFVFPFALRGFVGQWYDGGTLSTKTVSDVLTVPPGGPVAFVTFGGGSPVVAGDWLSWMAFE